MKNQGKGAHNNRENSGHPPSVDNVSSIPLICLLMKLRWLAGILVALMICPVADAEEKPPLRIGIHEMAPYATRNADGAWDGLGVELWKNIAATTGVRFVFVEMPFEQILPAVADGKLDAAVGEMTVTAERERAVRFTQPYLISSAGAAMYPQVANADWKTILRDFFNWTLALVLLGILAGMVLVSLLIWAIEHQHDAGHFRGGLTGFGSALWFSASTVTGVGYGDKIPASFAGRVISFVWMLMGVLLVAGLTATVTANMSAARVANLNGPRVKELGDLRHFSCGVMRGSLTQQILIRDGVGFRDYETFGEHQWEGSGIFEFLKAFPTEIISKKKFTFFTASAASAKYEPLSVLNVDHPISWADEERDLTAWLGNNLQREAFDNLYKLADDVALIDDPSIKLDWYNLQTSDHFYYMCTKFFSDGAVHQYFNPFESP